MSRFLATLLVPAVLAAPPAPKPIEPQQPLLNYVFPAGVQQGRTVEAVAIGANLAGGEILVTGRGVSARILDAKDPNKPRIAVTAGADAEPGERELRFVNAGGISNRFRFIVGQLPEINEAEPNSEKDKPQKLPVLPLVVNGQITDGDRDYFRFAAKAGQSLVLEVEARSLIPYIADAVPGWFDACLAVYDSSGKELQYADDFRFHPDPVMFFQVPQDGEYTVEIRDVIYRGRGDFIYRLSIGEQRSLPVSKVRAMAVTGRQGIDEAEPNDTIGQAQEIRNIPATVNGRIGKPGDADYYMFHASPGQKLVMEVMARRLGSPLDSILTLYNAKGDVLAENDDWVDPTEHVLTHHADSRLLYTFTAPDDYFLRIRDVQGNAGDEYGYHLTIAPPRPDFALRITPDNFRVGQGDTAAITVTALRKDGFSDEIRLAVLNLPEGFMTSDGVIPAGGDQARLTVTAPPDATIGVLTPVVAGSATIGKETVTHEAVATESIMQAFAYTHYLSAQHLFLAVVPATAYALTTTTGTLEVRPGSEVPILVKVLRRAEAKAPVNLTARLSLAGLMVKPALAAADQTEATLTLSIPKEAKPGARDNLIVSGVMRTGKETITRYAPAIPIRVVAAPTAR